ncbi:hypothetical protein WJX73_002479 [Symbiochloris irregularis]|uniref:Transmembrane protein 135 N-terminal domain-containing protein n=1 Tax=Symbiochloris irregularis TaxID=706552 RepID=A0AAW1PF60_9CHLO
MDSDWPEEDSRVDRLVRGLKDFILGHPERLRALHRWLNAVLRGAAIGFCLRGGLHVVSLAFALARSKRSKQRQTRQQSLWEKLTETGRYTAFLGALAGVFVGVDEGIAAIWGRTRTAAWRAFAAGLACGPTLLLTGSGSHNSLAIYVLLRGLVLLLGYSWILAPQTMPTAYINFLNYHGGKQLYHYQAVRELTTRNAQKLPPAPLKSLADTRHADFCRTRPCSFVHPDRGCNENLIAFLPAAYARALPVYLPVYFLPAILVHRRRLLDSKAGPEILAKVGLGALRSSAFLALYCAFAWRGACAGFQLTDSCTPVSIPATCWTGGLALFAEKKSRRMELALYVLSRAVESFALCLGQWGYVRQELLPGRLDVCMFSLATACILHCYSDAHGQHRDVFRSKYLNVLDFVLGSTGLELGSICHHPSTRDLLAPHIRRISSLARSLERISQDADMEEPDTPRGSFEAGISAFRVHTSMDESR